MKSVNACKQNSWHVLLFREEGNERICYRCRSWRHEGPCARWRASQDHARISEAISSREHWVYIVLTLDPKDWVCFADQYVGVCACWKRLRHRMDYHFGKIEYIQTWERFKKGGLHVNVLIHNEEIAALVRKNRFRWRRRWLEPHAVECGFGKRTWVEKFRQGTADQMAGYLLKISDELVGAPAKGQVPYDAPPHFRRIRASQGLLPKAYKSGVKGMLVPHPLPFANEETEL